MIRQICRTALLLLAPLLFGCGNDSPRLFTHLDESRTGIKFRNMLFEDGPMNVSNYIYFYNGGGVAVGDINNDGLQDICFTGNMVRNRLYLNKGGIAFEDITERSGIDKLQGWCTGVTMVDINHDGKLDIYISRSADIDPDMRKNLLFVNNGDLTFTEKAAEYGLADAGYSTQAGFFDYDKDGDLDCFIINHSLQKYTSGVQDNPSLRKEKNLDYASKLYRNDNNRFTNVSEEAGIISNVLTFGLGLAISDFDKDGWPDISVSNDFNEPDYLFINNRNGTFTEKLADCMDQVSLYSMGSDAADFNNDGLVDLVTLDMMPEDNKTQKMHSGAENFDKFQYLFTQGFYYQYSRNMLQKNNGDGTFSEIGQLAGVSNTDWSWAALFGDYDNDGYKDLFVTNGYVKDYTDMDFMKYSIDRVIRSTHHEKVDAIPVYISKMPTNEVPNYIFQNKGDGSFSKRTKDWGMDQKVVSAGAAYADLDNDGDMDLVVNNTNSIASIYKNNSEKLSGNSYLKINLQGDAKNQKGIGAKVTVYSKGNTFYQEQMPVRGFQSSVDPVLNFGLGTSDVADSVIIIWPDDRMQKLEKVKANQTLVAKLSDAPQVWKPDSLAGGQKLFTDLPSMNFTHRENVFNDFTSQSLLINYLSRQGPCMAKADINKDGREDLFIGGAMGQAGQMFLQLPDGRFEAKTQPSIARDSASEDASAEFFDADADGDMDLYVGSGGYEAGNNDPLLQDRLYINDGIGHFTKSEKALPSKFFSTGCVRASDINGDGAQDLFVGSRLIPQKYPFSEASLLLLNDGKGQFSDATAAVAPGFEKLGMVTDAIWMDVNKDASADLVVVGEWAPIKVFLNQKGRLTDASSRFIQFASGGWWNQILADDFDADGDKDLVIGNLGENAQFRASEKEPVSLHYKDFDGNGTGDLVFCYFIGGVSYPAASRDDLTEQLPALKKKFLEYHTYASATLNDLFTQHELDGAGVLKAELLSTVYLENTGAGFRRKGLPAEAQYAPVYAMAAVDANGDGKKDLVLGGNNSWTRIKFGRYTANHGTLLLGDGKGNFSYVPQWKSGLNIRGDVRSLVTISSDKKVQLLFGINNTTVRTVRLSQTPSFR